MTITAIQAQSTHVVLMAERDRLVRSDVLPGDVGRALKLQERRPDRREKKNNAENAGASESICTAVKYLGHESVLEGTIAHSKGTTAVP